MTTAPQRRADVPPALPTYQNLTRSREQTVVLLAVIAVGFVVARALDDAFIQPAAGLGPGDHVLSGLVPAAFGAVSVGVIWRTRAGLRSFATLLAGAWGLVSSMELFIESGPRGGVQADDVTSISSLFAGAFLICAFGYFAATAPSSGRSGVTRSVRRGAKALGLMLTAFLVVFPLGVGFMATHFAGQGITSAPDLGVPAHRVEFESGDGLLLTGWYAPTQNGAVVLILPGRSGIDQARMLARNGYGLLLMNRRGEGDSEGDTNLFGWADTRDVAGAAAYLRNEMGIAPDAIGGLGLSVGGEVMLEHASRSNDLAAVVAEGIGSRSIRESLELSGAIRLAELTTAPLLTTGVVVFGNQAVPPNLVDVTKGLAPARAFIIWGEHGQPAEKVLSPTYVEAAGGAATSWEVPNARHTRGIDAAPEEYEHRVVDFFDATLLGEH